MSQQFLIEVINEKAASEPELFAEQCEEIYNIKVSEVADLIKKRAAISSVVFLAGPSGSGKTTTALKVTAALQSIGITATTVSLDKYYKNHSQDCAPRLENGEIDYESPYLLDLELLNEHFHALDKGEEVIIPHFSFKTQSRDSSKETPLKLGEGKIVIFEGIHALNDLLCGEHPDAFKLYVSAGSDVRQDGEILFRREWTRLLRRIVRDNNFRGTNASDTLSMWANVRLGEEKYITPFKHKADYIFDSSMAYEVLVMKSFALHALQGVDTGSDRLNELSSILSALDSFELVDSELVPHDSILREFIGGGSFKY